MEFRTGLSLATLSGLALKRQRRCRAFTSRREAPLRLEASDFCRRPKTRVIAIPISQATRSPQLFAAGFTLKKTQSVQQGICRSNSAENLGKPIDWRIC